MSRKWPRVVVKFDGPQGVDMTKQSFAKEVDINEIIRRARKSGFLGNPSAVATRQAMYGDFSVLPNFHEMQDTVARVNAGFMELPPELRERFSNSPEKFLEFLGDPANREEAVKLGLLAPEVKKDAEGAVASGHPVGSEAPAGSAGGGPGASGAPKASGGSAPGTGSEAVRP